MTRENLMVLLASTGKKLEECEGECEVDTGRRIGADHIVSGEIQKVGTRYKMTLRLHDTHEGRLLSSSIGSGKSIDELDESAQKAAEELFTAR
jgi:TolB-like protein